MCSGFLRQLERKKPIIAPGRLLTDAILEAQRNAEDPQIGEVQQDEDIDEVSQDEDNAEVLHDEDIGEVQDKDIDEDCDNDETRIMYTREDVDALINLTDACILLSRNKIPYGNLNFDAAKQLLLQHISPCPAPQNTFAQNFKVHRALLGRLIEFYNCTLERIKTEDMSEIIYEFDGLYQAANFTGQCSSLEELLKNCCTEIDDEECPIVITGNVSAGKSCLINMLINEEIMPVFNDHMTSMVCFLHSSDDKRIILYNENRKEEHHPIPPEFRATEMQSYLKKLMKDRVHDNDSYEVHVYWPVAMLPPNVPIIDTPALNMRRNLAEITKAVSFMCVFNASLSEITAEIKDYFDTVGIRTALELTQKPPIFIFNKWDTISPNEQEEVRQRAHDTLRSYIQNIYMLSNDKWIKQHVFELSIKEVREQQRSGLHDSIITSRGYQDFIANFKVMLGDAFKYKAEKYHSLLVKVTDEINKRLVEKIRESRNEFVQHEKCINELESLIYRLEHGGQQLITQLKDRIHSYRDVILNRFYECIHSSSAIADMEDSCSRNCPNGNSFEVIEVMAAEKIDVIVKNKLENEYLKLYHEISNEIEKMVYDGYKEMLKDSNARDESNLSFVSETTKIEEEPFWTTPMILMVVFMPLYSPIALVSAIIGAPFLVISLIKAKVKLMVSLSEYRKNMPGYMKKWLHSCLQNDWSRQRLIDLKIVDQVIANLVSGKINELEQTRIPGTMEHLRRKKTNEEKSTITYNQACDRYSPLHRSFQILLTQLKLFRLQHLKNDPLYISFEHLEIDYNDFLGGGAYGSVYGAWLLAENEERMTVATKVFNMGDSINMRLYVHLSELNMLRKARHKHIVRLYGVSLEETEDTDDQPSTILRIHLILERCERHNLQQQIFDDITNIPGRHAPTSPERRHALRFYIKTALHISRGVAYIHNTLKCIHRDLKLSNILVDSNGVVKIGDFGFCVQELEVAGSYRGTRTHMAPEVFNGHIYFSSADIYSLSIIFWEMWYGRKYDPPLDSMNTALSTMKADIQYLLIFGDGFTQAMGGIDEFAENLLNLCVKNSRFPPLRLSASKRDFADAVRAGVRPSILDKYQPQQSLRDLLLKMWHGEDIQRPMIGDVIMVIRDLDRI